MRFHSGSCSAAVKQQPWVLFHQAAFQPFCSQPIALPGVVVSQGQYPAFGLVEFLTTGLDPLIQPIQIPLQIMTGEMVTRIINGGEPLSSALPEILV